MFPRTCPSVCTAPHFQSPAYYGCCTCRYSKHYWSSYLFSVFFFTSCKVLLRRLLLSGEGAICFAAVNRRTPTVWKAAKIISSNKNYTKIPASPLQYSTKCKQNILERERQGVTLKSLQPLLIVNWIRLWATVSSLMTVKVKKAIKFPGYTWN